MMFDALSFHGSVESEASEIRGCSRRGGRRRCRWSSLTACRRRTWRKRSVSSLTSVKNWYRAYMKGGNALDALNSGKHTGRPSRMNGEQLDRLGNMLLKGAEHYGYQVDLWTTERVAALIEEKFGIRYHPDHVRKILHGMNFSSQKAEGIGEGARREEGEGLGHSHPPRYKKS